MLRAPQIIVAQADCQLDRPPTRRSADFTACAGAAGGAGWRRQPPWVPHNLYCVAKRSASGSSTSFWYEDAAHPSRYGR